MKTLTALSLVLILFCFSANTDATELKFVALDNKITTTICMAAVRNNTELMKSKLRMLSRRGTALSYRSFVNTISCNKQYIGNFALTYGAENTSDYLNGYTNQWNKKGQSKVTITEIANKQIINKDEALVILVAGN